MIGKTFRFTMLSMSFTLVIVLLMSYGKPLILRRGSVAKMPMTALVCAQGECRVEAVYSSRPATSCDVAHGERLGFGYRMITIRSGRIEGNVAEVLHGRDTGFSFSFDLLLTDLASATGVLITNVRMARFYAPLWVLAVLVLAYPLSHLVLYLIRRRNRRNAHCCIQCGYDLTGNTSGTCPECGEPVHRPDASA